MVRDKKEVDLRVVEGALGGGVFVRFCCCRVLFPFGLEGIDGLVFFVGRREEADGSLLFESRGGFADETF